MDSFLYDTARSVIPVIILGILGYFTKKFLEINSNEKWGCLFGITVIAIVVYGFYRSYTDEYFSQPSFRQYIPENTLLLGAIPYTDYDDSFWLLEPDKVVSMPLYIKKNRVVTLRVQFDTIPLEMEYKTGNEIHKLKITNKNSIILNNILIDDFLSKDSKISLPTNKSDESMYAFKFKVSRQTKIYNYEFERHVLTYDRILHNLIKPTMTVIIVIAILTAILVD